ncbi:ump-cmp kinase [Lynx pardinus]|uniref:UMP-CMP kinase 2, mitochondrial n=1 Tax=Lynx pardinus TaxID=191816 RepID=A0A485P2K4_LYNPA|nr:ump-cmp kinase [Lynx pardinus]
MRAFGLAHAHIGRQPGLRVRRRRPRPRPPHPSPTPSPAPRPPVTSLSIPRWRGRPGRGGGGTGRAMASALGPRAPLPLARLRGARALAMAPPRRFALELPGCGLAHFAVGGDAAGARLDPRVAALLGPPGRSYSLCVPEAPGGGCAARVRAARLHQRLLHQLRRDPLRRCQLRRLLCYGPGGGAGGVQRGFLLRDPGDSPDTRRALFSLLGDAPGGPRLGEFVGDARQQCIPFIPEAQAVLDLVDQLPEQVHKGKFPVIAFEGLDATGKTTVTQSVSDTLGAVLLKSPPACISQWRKIFDDEPTIIRRAFYSLGNYIVASEIAKESTKSPVIIDRYWHSTATYAIATEVTGGLQYLPPAHHPIYQWPRDLLRPDLVLLLTVSPKKRMQRIEGRGVERTREEAELEADSMFRQKVEVSYQRMENPACHVVDASPSREEVLQTVLGIIQNNFS